MNAIATGSLETYELVGLIVIGVIALLPFAAGLLGIGLWVGGVARTALAAKTEAEALRERVHDLSNNLAAYKLEAGQQFVSQKAMENFERRVMGAIEGLGQRLDRLFTPHPPS